MIICRHTWNGLTIAPLLAMGLLLLAAAREVTAGDWPQILGPNRNGVARDEQPLQPWATSGPPILWKYPLGDGYAGPAVAGNRVVVFHRLTDQERVEALDATTGKPVWQANFPATYGGGINSDLGPRCVPLVHGKQVFVYGAAGDLHCVDLADGKKRWSRAAYQDFDGQEGYFGAGSTPIVAANKLIVNVGGRGAGLVAFDLQTGETLWQATDDDASYSSPCLATIDGQQMVIFVTRLNTVAVDPETGKVRFQFPFGQRGATVNAATPLVFDDHLFVSASYGIGAKLSRIANGQAQPLWANDDSMSSQYSTCVHYDGFLYGTHGREDYQNGELRCIEADTGKVRWTKPGFGVAHTILVGGQLLLLTVEGGLRLATATPTAYEELATASISNNITRALPAFANGRLYFRDNGSRGGHLYCLQFGE